MTKNLIKLTAVGRRTDGITVWVQIIILPALRAAKSRAEVGTRALQKYAIKIALILVMTVII